MLYPIICKVPQTAGSLGKKALTAALSCYARDTLMLSGQFSGFFPKVLKKDPNGAPIASSGVNWSIAHKPDYVCGVVSRDKTGIDLEKIKPVSEALFNRICTQQEAGLFPYDPRSLVFFRVFTAKEAVLKAAGVGLKGLSRVRVTEVPDALNIHVLYDNQGYEVAHFFVDQYIVSVVKQRETVAWQMGKL
ncbi:MAG: 4'-phosphopantetheinyl transferase superfamily protein [Thermodesulfobacteriota bacterium]|nr:4'-phosphopantetheinyl transferase superfamily protein [Thermodesulfobacteriota bacterium]